MNVIQITCDPKSGDFLIHRVKNYGTDNEKFFRFHPTFTQYHSALTFAQAMAAMYGKVAQDSKDNEES